MIAADIVEIDVDSLGRGRCKAFQDRRRLCNRRPGRRRANARIRTSPRRRQTRSRSCLWLWQSGPPPIPPRRPPPRRRRCRLPSRSGRVEQPEIGRHPGHAEHAEEAARAERRGPAACSPCAPPPPPHRASRPCAGRDRRAQVLRPCSRRPRRPLRRPSARRAGTAAHSFSRRSFVRACTGRPTATGS